MEQPLTKADTSGLGQPLVWMPELSRGWLWVEVMPVGAVLWGGG